MPQFPLFMNIKNKPVLIVGGGRAALNKVQKMAAYGPKMTVIASEMDSEVEKSLRSFPNLSICKRDFRKEDLDHFPELVIAATDSTELNHEISSMCKNLRIPVNVVDDPEACTFMFPAVIQKGKFSVGISTGGASPVVAVHFKEKFQELIPERLDEILAWLEEQRPRLKEMIPMQSRRAGAFRRLLDASMKKGAPLTDEEIDAYVYGSSGNNVGSVDRIGSADSVGNIGNAGCAGRVAMISVKDGKADLITVRDLKLLQQCDVVLYDEKIEPALLESAPESAQRICMRESCGEDSASQREISKSELDQKLLDLEKAGFHVVCLMSVY